MIARGVAASQDRKLGGTRAAPVAATYASQSSCPTTCAFLGNGCYAESGHTAFTTRRLNKAAATPLAIAQAESREIAALPQDGRPLRLHVVGDARTKAAARILGAASAAYAGVVWTYTHAWRRARRSDWGASVSVLASVETVADAKLAMRAGYAVAMVVDTFKHSRAYPISKGLKGIPCPQQTGAATDCATCKLCWRDKALRAARSVILFAAHGSGARKVRAAITQD